MTAPKKARKYNQQTGQPSGREINALKRRDDLTEQYIAKGADPGVCTSEGFRRCAE